MPLVGFNEALGFRQVVTNYSRFQMAGGTYSDLHRTFLQTMLSRVIVPKTTACQLLAQTSTLCGKLNQ